MKQLIKFGIGLGLVINTMAYALNPLDGFYGGLLGELSFGPGSYTILLPSFIAPPVTPVARVINNPAGGGGGGDIGYRFRFFRAEAEILYNTINVQSLRVGTCTLISPVVPSPIGDCIGEDDFLALRTGFNGSTSGIYAMINAYLDIYLPDCEIPWAPYIGIGVGGARIQRQVNFFNKVIPLPAGAIVTESAKVGVNAMATQGIVGVNLFLDDFAWIGLDYRYLTTGSVNKSTAVISPETLFLVDNTRYALHTLNLSVGFSFDDCSN